MYVYNYEGKIMIELANHPAENPFVYKINVACRRNAEHQKRSISYAQI